MRVVICSSVDSDLVRSVAQAAKGDEVFCQVSEQRYRRLVGGGWMSRIWLRWLTYAFYGLRLAARMLAETRKTVWIVTTNPFFAPGLACCAALLRGHLVVHHVFDLYPDAIEAARGGLRDGKGGLLGAWTRFTQKHSAAAVYLGDELRRHAENRHGAARISSVIPVAADERLFVPVWSTAASPLRIHYGGQLGLMHDAATIRECVLQLAPDLARGDVTFEFLASGARLREIEVLRGKTGVRFENPVAPGEWRRRASLCHIGLVTLSPVGAKVCLPSKSHAMMAAGMAIIAVCPENCDLATLVRASGAGWVVDNAGAGEHKVVSNLLGLVRRLAKDHEVVERSRRAARAYAESRCGYRSIEAAWSELLSRLPIG